MWEYIKETDGKYMISTDGRVKNTKTGKILKGQIDKGYKRVKLYYNGKSKAIAVHRLVAKAYVKNPNGYNTVNHIDGNKLNNYASNLEWCTAKQNEEHAFKTGLKQIKVTSLINVQTGDVMRFNSRHEACRYLNIPVRYLDKPLKGKERTVKNHIVIDGEIDTETAKTILSATINDKNHNKEQRLNSLHKNNQKSVVAVKVDGSETKEFKSVSEASTYFGINSGTISNVLNGKHKSTHGYVFRYKADGDK